MEIPRDKYVQELIDRKHNGLIKVITGIRRVGKSYLLSTLYYRHLIQSGVDADHIIRIPWAAWCFIFFPAYLSTYLKCPPCTALRS